METNDKKQMTRWTRYFEPAQRFSCKAAVIRRKTSSKTMTTKRARKMFNRKSEVETARDADIAFECFQQQLKQIQTSKQRFLVALSASSSMRANAVSDKFETFQETLTIYAGDNLPSSAELRYKFYKSHKSSII
ncbi:hypothetical protein Tcan_12740 [Toxocara canis]|uniref:Uncharacterized protein n=1 Tax=Toxocara canis TaxID=6265 RepID=A0A0B2VT30_TOXCA|nr:hypothetical protein Tcan_12740 [Toxocara canis]